MHEDTADSYHAGRHHGTTSVHDHGSRGRLRTGVCEGADEFSAWATHPHSQRRATGKTNRGPLDSTLDQLIIKHGASSSKGFRVRLGAAGLAVVGRHRADARIRCAPAQAQRTDAEFGGRSGRRPTVHIHGPGFTRIRSLHHRPRLPDAHSFRMIIADSIDGRPMSIGALGPLWAACDADRLAAFKDKTRCALGACTRRRSRLPDPVPTEDVWFQGGQIYPLLLGFLKHPTDSGMTCLGSHRTTLGK